MAIDDPCPHDSLSGDEGPVRDLPGGMATLVRWRCDACGAVQYDDDALLRLRQLVLPISNDVRAALNRYAECIGVSPQGLAQGMIEGFLISTGTLPDPRSTTSPPQIDGVS